MVTPSATSLQEPRAPLSAAPGPSATLARTWLVGPSLEGRLDVGSRPRGLRGMRVSRFGVVLLIAVALAGAPARADSDETEYRLKTAGVPSDLRVRIHAAIEKGAAWLARQQKPDGSFRPDLRVREPRDPEGQIPGLTALCSLALAHAATPDSTAAARKGLGYLLPGTSRVRSGVYDDTYTAGLTAMLIRSLGESRDVGQEIARRVARSKGRDDGWWAYGGTRTAVGANLSTSQFGALALWAGATDTDESVSRAWSAHLRSLLEQQMTAGGWYYNPLPRSQLPLEGTPNPFSPFHPGYPCGTCMGFANLSLARAGAADALAADVTLATATEAAVARGRARLDVDGAVILELLRGERTADDPWSNLTYELYALEKACVFADVETVGGRRWYIDAADVLVDLQEPSGRWTPVPRQLEGELVRSAFALLVLLRGSEVYRPNSPRDVNAPPVITPSDRDAPPAAVVAPAPPREIRIAVTDARDLIDVLEMQLGRKSAESAELVAAIDLVADAYVALAPDPRRADEDERAYADRSATELEAWRVAAEELLLRAFALVQPQRKSGENLRADVVVAAARALGRTHPRVAPRMRAMIDAQWKGKREREVADSEWLAAVDALTALRGPETATWMIDELVVVSPKVPYAAVAAAMDGLRHFPRLPGKARFELARKLVKLFAPFEPRARDLSVIQDTRLSMELRMAHLEAWRLLGPPMVRLFRHVGADATNAAREGGPDGRLPGWTGPLWNGAIQHLNAWLNDHEVLKRTPWDR